MYYKNQEGWQQRYILDQPRENDHRSPFERDRGRLLHSAAFRCLQGKTQIHAVGENDFYRTRLTHSLEVAQIGSSLVMQLTSPHTLELLLAQTSLQTKSQTEQVKSDLLLQLRAILPPISLIESLCFAHDIGHPPFGHGGEVALNTMMHEQGGFEGNAQTFRILTRLEPYTKNAGMNLTRRVVLGIIKYPTELTVCSPQYQYLEQNPATPFQQINTKQWKPGKGLFTDDKPMFDWVLQLLNQDDRNLFIQTTPRASASDYLRTMFKSLDCSIMEIADDIAYAVHDLEDAIVTGIITPQQWQQAVEKCKSSDCVWIQKNIDRLSIQLFSEHPYQRKNAIGELVNYFITHVRWWQLPKFTEPLLRYNAKLTDQAVTLLSILKKIVWEYVICSVDTQRIEYKGQRILKELFQIFESAPEKLLPKKIVTEWQQAKEESKKRVICDYIAGMSDAYALKVYSQL